MSPYEDYRTVEKTNFTAQTASSVPYLRSRPPVRLTLAGEPMGFFTVTDQSLTNAFPYGTHMFVMSRFKLAISVIIPPPRTLPRHRPYDVFLRLQRPPSVQALEPSPLTRHIVPTILPVR